MENINIYVGERIREFRKARKLTQRELGEKVDISNSTISDYENGITEPTHKALVKLAQALNVTLNDFFPKTPSVDYPDAQLSEEDLEFLKRLELQLASLDPEAKKSLLSNIEVAIKCFKE